MIRRLSLAACLLPALLFAQVVTAQNVAGVVFEDRDADGIHDAGEPGLGGISVRLFGTLDGGTAVDENDLTPADGSFSFAAGNGCYLLGLADPPGFRLGPSRADGFAPQPALFPVGRPRFAKMDQGIANLIAGPFRYSALGDSIARNFNVFCSPGGSTFAYSRAIRTALACVAHGGTVTLDEGAQLGDETDSLLEDDADNANNVFRTITNQPELVTLSIIGNDLLDVDVTGTPTQPQLDRAVAEILDSRQNLQEVLSALTSEIPTADIALNTLYDNVADDCYTGVHTTLFHRTWLPIIARMLRELAWGQARRVSINEVAAEFAHEDQLLGCTGYGDLICENGFDGIHPNANGYTVVREKVWEAVGGIKLGPSDAIGRTSIAGADYGYLRRVRRLLPASWETRDGAVVATPDAALDDADGGAAAAIQLGAGTEEFRVAGFPDWFDEIQIVRAIAGVRYRTSGTVGDDAYRMEASVTGQFRPPPGHAFNATSWNFYTPLVGGGGPNQPPANADHPMVKLLVRPNVASNREVSATLTKNPILAPGAAEYEWPALTHEELAPAAIRVTSAPLAATPGNDNYTVDLDAAWLDLYGWEKPRPAEVENLLVGREPDGSLEISFEPVAGAARYNVYFGRLDTVRQGAYDHGSSAPAGPHCDAATQPVGGGRLATVVSPASQPASDAYILVTAHADDVESPAGHDSSAVEIDRSQSICR